MLPQTPCTILTARLAQSVEHQTFKADFHSEQSEGQGFESLTGRFVFGGSRGSLMVSTQSEGSWFKSRSGQIAYFHGVKTRLSTLWTGDVPCGSDST